MGAIRFVPSRAGFTAVRKSEPVADELLRVGGKIARDAGDGFDVVSGGANPHMARAFVQAEDGNLAARKRNARDQVLLRALGKHLK